MITHSFSNYKNAAFGEVLKDRVSEYFQENKIQPTTNSSMVFKTILFFGLYAGLYSFILWGGVQNLIILFICWAGMGLLQAVIGMTVMHDKVHGAYTKHWFWNNLMEIPIVSIGVESRIWYYEHNVLHHNFTNVEGLDQDIHPRIFFRFSQNQPRKWFHRYQHFYAVFFYCFLLIEWLTVKDFLKVVKYRKMGFISSNLKALLLALQILLKKSIFYLLFLVIPILILPYSPLIITAMFLCMLVVGGVYMTIVFQLAHVVPNLTFIPEDEKKINENWHIHQMQTTANFANKNSFVTYLIGGLNFQIEHHLFPTISHVYYPEISPIVQQTAKEFGITYHSHETVWDALSGHFSLLKDLGRRV